MTEKSIIVILCGAPDRPITSLGGRTPLEAADLPNLDELARRGRLGMVSVLGSVVPPESDSGAMAILGFDPHRYYTGRGPLEAFGLGFIDRGEAGVGFRINFGSYDPARGALDRRTARDLEDRELQELVQAIRDELDLGASVRFDIFGFGRHRGIFCLRDDDRPLGGGVSNTDPGFRMLGGFGVPVADGHKEPRRCEAIDGDPDSRRTAELVNEVVAQTRAILARHPVNVARTACGRKPANVLLFRDGGKSLPTLPDFRSTYGKSLSFFGQIPAERGLCKLLGARFVDARQAEGRPDADYLEDLAARVVDDPAEVVAVHLKGADEPAHDGRFVEKVQALEAIDRHFVSALSRVVAEGARCIVTSDHSTPCELQIHSADPVPALLVGPDVSADPAERYDERSAAAGALGLRSATELLPRLFSGGEA